MSTTPDTPITERFPLGSRVVVTSPDGGPGLYSGHHSDVVALLGVIVRTGWDDIVGPWVDVRPTAEVNEDGDERPVADGDHEPWSITDRSPYRLVLDDRA